MANGRLIIVRHAHRAKDRRTNNGLSKKGKHQALELARQLSGEVSTGVIQLVSSPKRRCIETLEPLSVRLGISILCDDLLDEEGEKEGLLSLTNRVVGFFKGWKQNGEPNSVLCSHGDWIPIAMEWLTGKPMDIKKAGWVTIHIENRQGVIKKVSDSR